MSRIRPMHRDDWIPAVTKLTDADGQPFGGFIRADGQGGNPLFKALPHDDVETQLIAAYATLRARYPAITAARYHVRMPYWHGERVPRSESYTFVDAPQPLTTTAITVILIPQREINHATLGFHFKDATLPPLRDRLQNVKFWGVVGNIGYYMTADLINRKFRWSHNRRYPDYPLPEIPSYIGFHWGKERATGA
jgi:hypothetical protein